MRFGLQCAGLVVESSNGLVQMFSPPRDSDCTYEIVEFVQGERLVMRTADGPFPMETTYTWSVTGEGRTRMVLRNRGEPAGFSKAMAPLLTPAMRRANRKDLAMLASILESG